jgi:hypothetical protein
MAAQKPRKNIPGIKEVPMPPASSPMGKAISNMSRAITALVTPAPEPTKAKATRRPRGSAPKPVRIEPHFGGSGMRIFVGESKIPVCKITQETLDEAYADFGFGPSVLIAKVSFLETQGKEAADRAIELAGKWEKAEAEVEKLTTERDAARLDTEQWRIAAGRNLEDLNTTQTKLAELRKGFDELTTTASQRNANNTFEKERLRAELHRAKMSRLIVAFLSVAACIATYAFGGVR